MLCRSSLEALDLAEQDRYVGGELTGYLRAALAASDRWNPQP